MIAKAACAVFLLNFIIDKVFVSDIIKLGNIFSFYLILMICIIHKKKIWYQQNWRQVKFLKIWRIIRKKDLIFYISFIKKIWYQLIKVKLFHVIPDTKLNK